MHSRIRQLLCERPVRLSLGMLERFAYQSGAGAKPQCPNQPRAFWAVMLGRTCSCGR
jgi:hypothetical protein